MKKLISKRITAFALWATVAVSSSLAVDQFPPCWRAQPGTTFQKWGFDATPADPFPTAATPSIYPSPDAGSVNPYGVAQAQVVVEPVGLGWTASDPSISTTLSGFWDLGYGGAAGGSVTLTVPNTNAVGSVRYISVQVTEAIAQDATMTNTVTVVGGTLLGGNRITVETNPNFTWVVSQSFWQVPANTPADTITIVGGCQTCNSSGGGENSFVEDVEVDTMTRSPAQNDVATVAKNNLISIPVLANDGGPTLTIASVGAVGGIGGTAVINGANIDYTAPNATGTATFSYVNRDCSNNTSSATVTVTVNSGAVPPAITTCATNQTLIVNSSCQAAIPDLTGQVVATPPGVVLIQLPAAGSLRGVGVVPVTLIASNISGTATCTATMTVIDQTPPVLGAMPANIVVTRTAAGGATNVTFTLPSATDNCAASPAVTCTPPSGSTFPLGVNMVTCVANDGNGNTATNTFTVTVQPGFTYTDGDLLLVFRKAGFNDVLFNLGTVNNYVGQPNGTVLNVNNFNQALVTANFGGSLVGVEYALLVATSVSDPVLRVWLSDASPTGVPACESYSKWAGQRSLISALGTAATSYFNSSNQTLVLPPTDPGSYTYIMSGGGTLDVASLGGSVSFPVEQSMGSGVRFFQLGVCSQSPAPATELGGFNSTTGGNLAFTAGYLPVVIVAQPSSQTVECGSIATLTVSATGEPTLSYQWFKGVTPVGANSPTLTISPASVADSGSYTVRVTGGGGDSLTSAAAILTVHDTVGPVITLNGLATTNIACGSTYTDAGATAFDVCDNASATVTINTAAVNTSAAGSYLVTLTATDSALNVSHATRTVVVASVVPPVVTLIGPSTTNVECHTAWIDPSAAAHSVCGGSSLAVNILGTANLNSVGSYTLTYYALDGTLSNGVTRVVNVIDTTAPVLTAPPANIVVTRTSFGGATVGFTAPTANDTCAGPTPVVCTPASGSTFPLGVNTVNCVATDPSGNSKTNSFTVTVQPGFTYADGDLLLVFRKAGFNDVLFNLGTVNNYVGQPNGSVLNINNFNQALVTLNFGGSLVGVEYALLAATSTSDPVLRVWLSDASPTGVPGCESYSKWAGQRSLISALGTAATSYFNSSNQTLVLPPTDPGSYTYIMSQGGTLDVASLGGAVSFPVEQSMGSGVRFFQIGVCSQSSAPAVELGGINTTTGGTLTFTGGFLPIVIVSQPSNQSAECTGSATFTVSATGEPPLSYQWLHGATPVGGNSATLTISPVSFADAGSYTVVVSGGGGSSPVTSSPAVTLTVHDTTPPIITFCPGNTNLTANTLGTTYDFTSTAVDSCDGPIVPVCTPPSGHLFLQGSTLVTCVATDSHGNSSSPCTFTVTVQSLGASCVTTNVVFNPPIPDANGNGFASTLTIASQIRSITDMRVTLNVSNGWNGDLYAYLVHTSPSGSNQYAVLLNRVGRAAVMSDVTATPFGYDPLLGYEDPGFNITLDDTAANDVHLYGLTAFAPGNNSLGGPLTGTWQPDGRNTNPTNVLDTDPRNKMLAAFTGMDPNGDWTLFITDSRGGNISDIVSWGLNICGNWGPAIVQQPASQSSECGSNVTFTVLATGFSPLSYQWYFGANALLNATNSSLVVSNVHAINAGVYTVAISNATGFVLVSDPATLAVVDTIPPVLTLNGSGAVTVECHTAYTELGAIATDSCLGTLTGSIVITGTVDANTPGVYTVTYTVSDGSNTSTATRTVTVSDTTVPVVTLHGPATYTVECPHTWTEPGADATDTCAGSLPVSVHGTVNVFLPGTYILTYSAMDPSGNVGTATRTVTVVDTQPPVITVNGATTITLQCPNSFVDPGATALDACSGGLLVTSSGTVDVKHPNTYVITYSATDGAGHTSTATRTVIVQDTTPPVVTLVGPASMTLECHAAWADPGANASDACAGVLPVIVTGTVNPNLPGSYTLTYTATDPSLHATSVTRTVIVQDTTPPTIICPANMVVSAGLNNSNAVVSFTTTVSDLCDSSPTLVCSPASGATFSMGTTPVTCTATDASGNRSSCGFTVTVVDNQRPVVTLNGASVVTVECHRQVYKELGATATDNSGLPVSVTISGTVPTNSVGTYTVTYRAIDGSGNIGIASRTVIVQDTTGPVVTLIGPDPLYVECHGTYTEPGASALDACAGALEVTISGVVDATTPGTYTRTYVATDPSGNSTTITRHVIVRDTTPPVLTLEGANPLFVECHTPYTEPGWLASDACAGDLSNRVAVTGIVNANSPGIYLLTYKVQDDAGNATTLTRTVIVRDTIPPVVTLNGSGVMVLECATNWVDPGAIYSDTCAGSGGLLVTTNGNVDLTRPGVYTLVYSATDPSHNTASATRTVIVQDTKPPTVTLNGGDMIVECHTEFVDPGATAVNGCAGPLSVSVQGSVDVNTPGTYYLLYTATDFFGNSGDEIRAVLVIDTTAPVVSLNGFNPMTVECHTPYVEPGASALDACAGILPVTITGTVLNNAPGSYTVTYAAIDPSGNSNVVTRTVNVIDTIAPTLTLPADMTVVRTEAGGATVTFTASATDACAGVVPVVCSPSSGSLFPLGATVVACSASDGNGNTRTGAFTVTVQAGDGYFGTDLLLVLRKSGYDDVLFNVGNVSNLLSLPCGTFPVDNWDQNLALTEFGGSLQGVEFIVTAGISNATEQTVWVTDSSPTNPPAGETPAQWAAQSPIIDQVGASLNTYNFGPHQSLVLWTGDPGSYDYIVSGGGAGDVSTWSGAAPFTVEQPVPGSQKFLQLDVSNIVSQVGGFSLTPDAHLTFTRCSQQAPVIAHQPAPASQLVECSSNATFTVAATGDPTLTYQWYKGVSAIGGATSNTLNLAGVHLADQANYWVVVANTYGSVTSSVVTLLVEDTIAPVITLLGSNPLVVTCGAYTDPGATAMDACAGDLTTSIVTLSTVVANVAGSYQVVYMVTDEAGNFSQATRTVIVQPSAPVILTQPQDVLANLGSNATFSVVATSCGQETYQWYVHSVSLPNALLGETGPSLTIPNVQYADNGNTYIVVVSNSQGSTPSAPALLTVNRFPVAFSLGAGTTENAPVRIPYGKLLDDDYDPDAGDAISIVSVSPLSAHAGTVALDGPNNEIVYTPAHGFHGVDTFTYTIADNHGAQTSSTVEVYVADGVLPSMNEVNISHVTGSVLRVRFVGIPGESYTLEFTAANTPYVWLPMTSAVLAPVAAYPGNTPTKTAQSFGVLDWYVNAAFLPPATLFRVANH